MSAELEPFPERTEPAESDSSLPRWIVPTAGGLIVAAIVAISFGLDKGNEGESNSTEAIGLAVRSNGERTPDQADLPGPDAPSISVTLPPESSEQYRSDTDVEPPVSHPDPGSGLGGTQPPVIRVTPTTQPPTTQPPTTGRPASTRASTTVTQAPATTRAPATTQAPPTTQVPTTTTEASTTTQAPPTTQAPTTTTQASTTTQPPTTPRPTRPPVTVQPSTTITVPPTLPPNSLDGLARPAKPGSADSASAVNVVMQRQNAGGKWKGGVELRAKKFDGLQYMFRVYTHDRFNQPLLIRFSDWQGNKFDFDDRGRFRGLVWWTVQVRDSSGAVSAESAPLFLNYVPLKRSR